jgi:phosphoribosyl 1,2-cyclic phosphodiesterase
LGSGSDGNAWLVEAGATRVLIDCGFGPRETERRLRRLDASPQSISAVIVTHEHSDHIGGAVACARRFGWALHLTAGSRLGLKEFSPVEVVVNLVTPGRVFSIGELQLSPCTVPHDAREPVQYVASDGQSRLGILTDAGHISQHMVEQFDGCDALVLECNHDAQLLARGRYPAALKRRIASDWGHLENAQAATLLMRLGRPRLRHLVAAHLSAENNRAELARASLAAALDCEAAWIGVADQNDGLAWRDL